MTASIVEKNQREGERERERIPEEIKKNRQNAKNML